MNKIQFNIVLNDDGNPIGYDVSGAIIIDNEKVDLGFSCFYFEKAFNELCYWVNQCPKAQIDYTTSSLKVTA